MNKVTLNYKLCSMKSREIKACLYMLAKFIRWICGKNILTEEISFLEGRLHRNYVFVRDMYAIAFF